MGILSLFFLPILSQICVDCNSCYYFVINALLDYGAFQHDLLFQDACCMCVVQIGELASLLSEDVRRENPSVPWRVIKDTRNYYVHDYGSIDIEAVWDTLNHDLPELKSNCQKILNCE